MTTGNQSDAHSAETLDLPQSQAGLAAAAETTAPFDPAPIGKPTIAPWWNVALIVVLIAATSVLGSLHQSKNSMAGRHLANYGATIALEWVLAGIALWGTRLKKTPLRELLGERRHGARELLIDVGAAAVFWVLSLTVLGALALLLRMLHFGSAQKQISQLAPTTLAEGVLWIALSITAGICEEFLFRGFLQQQFARASGRVWVGVVVSAVLFGCAHGYEGIAGMLMITVYGALFSMLALRRGSLRAGMIAHAWHDSITGVALWMLNRAHVPLGVG
jgi:membrane protease YdiL (CAAX protease family)